MRPSTRRPRIASLEVLKRLAVLKPANQEYVLRRLGLMLPSEAIGADDSAWPGSPHAIPGTRIARPEVLERLARLRPMNQEFVLRRLGLVRPPLHLAEGTDTPLAADSDDGAGTMPGGTSPADAPQLSVPPSYPGAELDAYDLPPDPARPLVTLQPSPPPAEATGLDYFELPKEGAAPLTLGRLAAPATFLSHYVGGSGEPKAVPFSGIDTSGVRLSDFRAIREQLAAGKPGTYTIRGASGEFSTGLPEAAYLGRIVPTLDGTLTIGPKRDYSFEGTLGAKQDTYDFDPDDRRRRSFPAEASTRIGAMFPGKAFKVPIAGNRKFRESGTFRVDLPVHPAGDRP